MKRKLIWILVFVILAVVVYSYYDRNTIRYTEFSDEFLTEFNFDILDNPETREKVRNSDCYRLSESDTMPNLWEVFLQPNTAEFIFSAIFDSRSFEPRRGTYSLYWGRPNPNDTVYNDFSEHAVKAKYWCSVAFNSGEGDTLYLTTYGDSVKDCIRRMEELLLKFYYDLRPESPSQA